MSDTVLKVNPCVYFAPRGVNQQEAETVALLQTKDCTQQRLYLTIFVMHFDVSPKNAFLCQYTFFSQEPQKLPLKQI